MVFQPVSSAQSNAVVYVGGPTPTSAAHAVDSVAPYQAESVGQPVSQMSAPTKLQAQPPTEVISVNGIDLLPPLSTYDRGRIGTPPEAGMLSESGLANVTFEAWNQQLEQAAIRNSGFGNADEGFLAWGIHGFFRFANDSIPAELAQKYAQMSLYTGIPIEKLKIGDTYSGSEIAGKNEFADKFLSALDAFFQNPNLGFSVDGGGQIYKALADPNTGRVTFYSYKKSGWASFLKPVMKILKPIAKVLPFIPGVGSAAKALVESAVNVLDMSGKYTHRNPVSRI